MYAWKYRVNRNVNTNCPVCVCGAFESVLHRFWECPYAQTAWRWGIFILNKVAADNDEQGPWCPLTWKHGIFSDRMPRRFDKVRKIWMAIRGIVIWLLWLERNDAVFNDVHLSREKVIQKVWLGIIDYGRKDWEGSKMAANRKFESIWCRNKVLAEMNAGKPHWRLAAASNGFDVH
jgi:hypothetical protein